MPTLDVITLSEEEARRRRRGRVGTVRPRWCEACREAHVWCSG
jgi:hypothetical protein